MISQNTDKFVHLKHINKKHINLESHRNIRLMKKNTTDIMEILWIIPHYWICREETQIFYTPNKH
jgi:hypothetical protein